jgi:hypothetical protein
VVRLQPTDELAPDELRARLRADPRAGDVDPLSFAAAESKWEWEHRWPKRPRWLSRRLHGDDPKITV